MEKIKISVNCLAKYMTSTPSQQRKILQGIKYKTDENRAMINYYKEARSIIKEYYKFKFDSIWLINKARQLDQQSALLSGQSRIRLRRNGDIIRNYANYFKDKIFDYRSPLKLKFAINNVCINIYPDLNVLEKKKNKIIKLDFVKNLPDRSIAKIICQLTFEACKKENIILPSSYFEYFDVERGSIHKFARSGSKLKADIEATCLNIEAVWDSIPNPSSN
jgi:hypothetical protein